MTFLQPYLLWLLPLAALPVVIHLLNRMRFRTMHWAAMSFLFSANRASTHYARLRQWLLLACRVLALLAMLLAVARPLAGGWAGWIFSGAPDVVLILLDRSASMEARDAQTSSPRRRQALEQVASAAAAYGDRTRCVLFESVARAPQEVAQPILLPRLPNLGPTDTACEMPALFEAAAAWLERNHAGLAEIWIASDLQRSNWQPGSPRWHSLSARLAALPGTVRVRLLAPGGPSAPNASVTLVSAVPQLHAAYPALHLVFDVRRDNPEPATLPVTITLDGAPAHVELAVTGAVTRVHRLLPLDPARPEGCGSIDLPPDGNERDNRVYFIHAPAPRLRAAIVGPDDATRKCLAAATAPVGNDTECDFIERPPDAIDWDKYALVLWHAPLPGGALAKSLESYVAHGGAAMFFPTADAEGNAFAKTSWGDPVQAAASDPLRVTHWDRHDGPLADTESGAPLALPALRVSRARAIISGGEIRAMLGDNAPLLSEIVSGRGRAYFCGTLPQPGWSTLDDGRVLVPMLQRILEQGARRLVSGSYAEAGDPSLVETGAATWTSLAGGHDARAEAGVYRNGPRLVAINRPADEDDPDRLPAAEARRLFSPLPAYSLQERGDTTRSLQGEVWRPLLFAMLIFLIGESLLSLPAARPAAAQVPSPPGASRPPLAAARA